MFVIFSVYWSGLHYPIRSAHATRCCKLITITRVVFCQARRHLNNNADAILPVFVVLPLLSIIPPCYYPRSIMWTVFILLITPSQYATIALSVYSSIFICFVHWHSTINYCRSKLKINFKKCYANFKICIKLYEINTFLAEFASSKLQMKVVLSNIYFTLFKENRLLILKWSTF